MSGTEHHSEKRQVIAGNPKTDVPNVNVSINIERPVVAGSQTLEAGQTLQEGQTFQPKRLDENTLREFDRQNKDTQIHNVSSDTTNTNLSNEESLKDKTKDLKENVNEKVTDVKEKAKDVKENVKEKAKDVKEDVKDKATDVKEKAKDVKEDVKEKVKDVKEKTNETYEKGKEKIEEKTNMVKMLKYARYCLQNFINPQLKIEKQIPIRILSDAFGLVFLTEYKGSFGIGSSMGTGLIIARKPNHQGWTGPCAIGMGGLSIGFQAGIQKIEHVMVLRDEEVLKTFVSKGQLKLGGDISFAVGPLGRDAQISLNINDKDYAPVYSYSMSKGLHLGASLEGQIMIIRDDCNEDYYGKKVSAKDILFGKVDSWTSDNEYSSLIRLVDEYTQKQGQLSQGWFTNEKNTEYDEEEYWEKPQKPLNTNLHENEYNLEHEKREKNQKNEDIFKNININTTNDWERSQKPFSTDINKHEQVSGLGNEMDRNKKFDVPSSKVNENIFSSTNDWEKQKPLNTGFNEKPLSGFNEKSDINFNERPLGSSFNEKPLGTTFHERPLGTTFNEKPLGTTFHEKPLNTNLNEKPLDTTYHEKPLDTTFHTKPLDTTYHEKPLDTTFHTKPLDTTFHTKPLDTTFHTKPLDTTYHEKPLDTTFHTKPLDTTYHEKPLNININEKPLGTTFHEKPLSTGFNQNEYGLKHENIEKNKDFNVNVNTNDWNKQPLNTGFNENERLLKHEDKGSENMEIPKSQKKEDTFPKRDEKLSDTNKGQMWGDKEQRINMDRLLKHARFNLENFMNPKLDVEKQIPVSLLKNACGILFLTEIKGGLGIGGSTGTGFIIACKPNENEFSQPCAVGMGGISLGLQIGGQKTEHIFIFRDEQVLRSFIRKGELNFGGDVSFSIGPLGRDMDTPLNASDKGYAAIYSYSMANGAYLGVTMERQMLKIVDDWNEDYFGKRVSADEILFGNVKPLSMAQHQSYEGLINLIREYRENKGSLKNDSYWNEQDRKEEEYWRSDNTSFDKQSVDTETDISESESNDMRRLLSHAYRNFQHFVSPNLAIEKKIPIAILSGARAIIFLTELKAGLVVGASMGRGFILARRQGTDAWTGPCAISLGGMSVGWLAGAEKTKHILVLRESNVLQEFLSKGQLKFGGNLSFAAGPLGRDASISVNVNDKGYAPIYSYSFSKGAYIGASLDGHFISIRDDINEAYYGTKVKAEDILHGLVESPKNDEYRSLCDLLDQYISQSLNYSADTKDYKDVKDKDVHVKEFNVKDVKDIKDKDIKDIVGKDKDTKVTKITHEKTDVTVVNDSNKDDKNKLL